MQAMEVARIDELLMPFMGGEKLSLETLERLGTYLELLLRWNARMNMTSVRDPESIVQRHFGESCFSACTLFPVPGSLATVVDVGSGAGFPGLPIAILRPNLEMTLIEAHGKKATFLKEVVRALRAENVRVALERAENYRQTADVVTLRAVEDFASILPISARIVAGSGRLAALLGLSQTTAAEELLGNLWESGPAIYFPGSSQRALWIARHR